MKRFMFGEKIGTSGRSDAEERAEREAFEARNRESFQNFED